MSDSNPGGGKRIFLSSFIQNIYKVRSVGPSCNPKGWNPGGSKQVFLSYLFNICKVHVNTQIPLICENDNVNRMVRIKQ